MMMRNRQRGMTFVGWLILLAFIGVITLITLRLAPGYMEYYTVRQAVEQVHNQATAETTVAEIRTSIQRRFQVNDVKSLSARDIAIGREDGRLLIHVFYEFRTPVFGNVDAVLVFDRVFGDP